MTEATVMKSDILKAAVRLAKSKGFRNFSREDVAEAAKTATGTVSYHYRGMAGLRKAVMQYAIDNEVLEIIAQGLAERHAMALKAREELRLRAAGCLAK